MAKLNWLDEVKADAEYITKKRIRDYQEEQLHKASKRADKVDEYTETETAKGTMQYRKNGKLISKETYLNRG